MQGIIRELETNMSTRESASYKCYRKTAHPRTSDEGQGWEETDVNDTLNIFDTGEVRTPTLIKEEQMDEKIAVVRRLTPTECERLQGYPDGWTDIGEWTDSNGKKHKDADTPRYKALGNSIALPFWQWLIGRIANKLREDGVERPTMASLFDGIGGFPLVSQRNGVEPIWASEIEEFPIAVTKIRFPEGGEDEESNNNDVGGNVNRTNGDDSV